MRHEHDGEALVVELAQVSADLGHRRRVHAGGWLVEHEHPWLHCENAGKGNPALLAAGKVEGTALGDFRIIHAHTLERLSHASVHLVIG